MITVPETEYYQIESRSDIDTYGYLYLKSFNPWNTAENLITGDDDKAGDMQFAIVHLLTSTSAYILVVTTSEQNVTGPFSVMAYGPKRVTFSSLNNTSSTTTATVGSTTRAMTVGSTTSTMTVRSTTSSSSTGCE